MKTTPRRMQTRGEEIANSVSHGIGLLAAAAAVPILVVGAIPHGPAAVVGVSIFGAAMVLLYLSSALYHGVSGSRGKHVLRTLDHGAIFLLIAGTYTPFTLGVLRGGWGWTLFGLIWSLAAAGLVLDAVGVLRRRPVLSTSLYVAMGWLIVIAARPMWLRVAPAGLLWLLAGGVCYTAGVTFYGLRQLRYAHFVWHLFVLAGSTCHFFAVLWYAT